MSQPAVPRERRCDRAKTHDAANSHARDADRDSRRRTICSLRASNPGSCPPSPRARRKQGAVGNRHSLPADWRRDRVQLDGTDQFPAPSGRIDWTGLVDRQRCPVRRVLRAFLKCHSDIGSAIRAAATHGCDAAGRSIANHEGPVWHHRANWLLTNSRFKPDLSERLHTLSLRSRTAILRSTLFLKHDTGDHPERSSRIIAIDCELERRHLLRDRPVFSSIPASDEAIHRVHAPELLQRLDAVATSGGGWIDADTVVRPESVDVARLAAGAAIVAVDAILDNEIDRAFVIARPPGHHATANRAMGFCLLNSIAIAAAHAIERGLQRVAILDWDVHHGNGTQDIFYGRSDVLFCSLHQSPLFPGTGSEAENGLGTGAGFTLNVPLPAGADDEQFLNALRERIIPAISEFAPQLLLISAGYDAHLQDPIGGMEISDAGFQAMMTEAVELANRHCQGRLLALLEGGYHAQALARCVADAIEILDRSEAIPRSVDAPDAYR